MNLERHLGAILLASGIVWLWDYVSSLYFPGRTSLNLTILSFLVYMEASFIGAVSLTRRTKMKHIPVGMRIGLGTFLLNITLRLLLFELDEALWGVVVYFMSLTTGGLLGGVFAKRFHMTPTEGTSF